MTLSSPASAELMEEVRGLDSTHIDAIKDLCRNDLFFLSKAVLGYDQVSERAHGALCAFLVREPAPRRMILLARGHLKSTLSTISDSIRLAIRAPNKARILIANETATNAEAFLDEIKNHWTTNELLRQLFPELVPKKLVGPGSDWSSERASLQRTSPAKEATWNAIGVGGAAVSKHFSHIKCDDLIGERAKESPADMARAIRWNNSIEPLLDSLDNDIIDWIGTRKTLTDLYSHVMGVYGDDLRIFLREPIENGEPIFEKFSIGSLTRIMEKTPDVWYHDYMNNPVGKGATDWGPGLVRYYTVDNDGKFVFEDTLTSELKGFRLSELDVVITVDPNSGKAFAPDKAAVVVHGITPDDDILVLESFSGRPSPDGLVDKAFELCQKWKPRVVGFESAGQQNTLFYFGKKMDEENEFFNVQELKHNNKAKEDRIRAALDTPLKARRIYLLRSQLDLNTQITLFPQLAEHNWDEIDCLSYGPQLYRKGMRSEDLERTKNVHTKILALRGRTGYGRSYRR